jgi:hypothetical protein
MFPINAVTRLLSITSLSDRRAGAVGAAGFPWKNPGMISKTASAPRMPAPEPRHRAAERGVLVAGRQLRIDDRGVALERHPDERREVPFRVARRAADMTMHQAHAATTTLRSFAPPTVHSAWAFGIQAVVSHGLLRRQLEEQRGEERLGDVCRRATGTAR